MSIDARAAEIARQYITRTVDAPVSGELMIVCSDSVPAAPAPDRSAVR